MTRRRSQQTPQCGAIRKPLAASTSRSRGRVTTVPRPMTIYRHCLGVCDDARSSIVGSIRRWRDVVCGGSLRPCARTLGRPGPARPWRLARRRRGLARRRWGLAPRWGGLARRWWGLARRWGLGLARWSLGLLLEWRRVHRSAAAVLRAAAGLLSTVLSRLLPAALFDVRLWWVTRNAAPADVGGSCRVGHRPAAVVNATSTPAGWQRLAAAVGMNMKLSLASDAPS
jgi:hypothetical protein